MGKSKHAKKLSLHKESLRRLSGPTLGGVMGAAPPKDTRQGCVTLTACESECVCPTNTCLFCSWFCPPEPGTGTGTYSGSCGGGAVPGCIG